MAYKKIGDWDDLRLDGILAWIHRIVMFLTFPLRNFWSILVCFIAICILLVIIALYCGVPLKQIGPWYKSMLPAAKSLQIKDEKPADTFTEAATDKETDDTGIKTSFRVKTQKNNNGSNFAVWHIAEIKAGKYKPQPNIQKNVKQTLKNTQESFAELKKKIAENIQIPPKDNNNNKDLQIRPLSETTAQIRENEPETTSFKESSFYSGELADYYEYLENRGLIYPPKPDILIGTPTIRGANSLYMNGVFLFLYGIYTDPHRYDVASAEKYLRDLTANTQVYCAIVAYTAHSHTATALCFANGVFINKAIVKQNLADNVGLK